MTRCRKWERKFSLYLDTTNNEALGISETWIWIWSAVDIETGEVFGGTSSEDLLAFIEGNPSSLFYVWDLSFYGWALLDSIQGRGWDLDTLGGKKSEGEELSLVYIRGQKGAKHFTFYSVNALIHESLEDMVDLFEVPIKPFRPLHFKIRPRGDEQPTPEEIEGARNNALICARVISAGYSLGYFTTSTYTITQVAWRQVMQTRIYRQKWDLLSPELPERVKRFSRNAYIGGVSWLKPEVAGVPIGAGVIYDVNSLYPSCMLRPLPIGEAHPFEGEPPARKLWIAKVNVSIEVLPGHPPLISQEIQGTKEREYITDSEGYITLYLTSVDWEILTENYRVWSAEFLGGYWWESKRGIFSEFVHTHTDLKRNYKATGNACGYQLEKRILNTAYGTLGRKIDQRDISGKLIRPSAKKSNIPMACFITAYGRRKLSRAITANWSRFLYCDTDSIHLRGREPAQGIQIDESALGAWKREYEFTKAVYARRKVYRFEGQITKNVVAGLRLSEAEKLTAEDYLRGREVITYRKARAPGGCVRVPKVFTLRPLNEEEDDGEHGRTTEPSGRPHRETEHSDRGTQHGPGGADQGQGLTRGSPEGQPGTPHQAGVWI